jgi:hypothetical protein
VSSRKPTAAITTSALSTGLLLTGLTTGMAARAAAANDLYSIRLEAASRVLRSDGRSDTVISAYVYDEKGNAAPNGTRVIFNTTLGRLDTVVAVTDNGVARANLIAADQPGEAVITANIEGRQAVQTRLSVRFTADAERTDEATNWIRVDGEYVGYVADPSRRVIHASGKNGSARISYRSFAVSADTIQYRVTENRLLAVGNVTIEMAGVKRQFNNLVFNFNMLRGTAERLEDGKPVPYRLAGPNMEDLPYLAEDTPPTSDMWQLDDLSGANVAVVTRSLALERDKRVQFRRATFYIDGQKTVSMPFHEMGLDQETIFKEQIVGIGSQGLTIDVPVYYDVRPSAVGTLHVRHSASVNGSVYAVRPGLSLDAVQSYSGKNQANGTFEAIGLTRPDWGLRFQHSQRVEKNTTARALIDFPSHENLYLNTQFRHTFKTFALNASGAFSRSPNQTDFLTGETGKVGGNVQGQLYADTYARPFLNQKTVTYALNAGVARQSTYGFMGVARGAYNTENVGARLNTTPYTIARATTLSQSVSIGQAWLQGGNNNSSGTATSLISTTAQGLTFEGITQISRNVEKRGSVGLTYQYRQAPIPPGLNATYSNPKHLFTFTSFLSGTLTTRKLPWQFNLLASQAADRPQSTIGAGTRFSFGGPWSGQVRFNYSKLSNYSYNETEYALVRRISGRDFAVYYSTLSKRFQLDFSGALARF